MKQNKKLWIKYNKQLENGVKENIENLYLFGKNEINNFNKKEL